MMNAVAIDSDGFLWLGTNEGLNRYDGRTFKVYYHSNVDTTSIASNHVLALHVDTKNRIWIATEGKGIDCFDRYTEKFTHYTTSNGLGSNNIHGWLAEDNHEGIIVEHDDGKPADIIVPKNGSSGFEIKRLTAVYPGIAKATANKEMGYLAFTANGDLWCYAGDS